MNETQIISGIIIGVMTVALELLRRHRKKLAKNSLMPGPASEGETMSKFANGKAVKTTDTIAIKCLLELHKMANEIAESHEKSGNIMLAKEWRARSRELLCDAFDEKALLLEKMK